jgi:DNA-directed RNA polymerase II subunit RPB3
MPNQRFPQIEILDMSQPNEMRFILSKTDTSMANTLRRIMIAEVPTLAIDLVEFHENSTVLNDEYLAHRLGLIPLKYVVNYEAGQETPQTLSGGDVSGAFLPHRDCVCYERCPRCSVELELDVAYDSNHSAGEDDLLAPLTVTSKDLRSKQNPMVQPAHFLNQDEADESQDEGIAIVKLGPGQHLKLKAIARLGISKEHSKWCPVAVATYKFWPIIEINEEACNSQLSYEQKQALVDECSDGILELDPVTGNLQPAPDAWDKATFTEDLMFFQQSLKKRPEDDDFVTVTPSQEKFIFTVESTGAMAAQEIVMSALRVLKDKLNYLAQEVENLKEM